MEELELIINANKKIKKSDQFKYKALATFRCKIMADQLPTRSKLHKRYPNLYDNDHCSRCEALTENLQHVFNCTYALKTIIEKKEKIIELIQSNLPKNNNINNNDNNGTPNHNHSVAINITGPTLINLALGNFQPPLNTIKNKEDISNKALKILYKIWKQRSATATTSPTSGIKWKKTKAAKHNTTHTTDNNIFQKILNLLENCNNLTDKKIFTPTIVSSF
jgi:hypothetical protein